MPAAGMPAAGMPEAGMPEAGMPDAGYDPHRSLFSQLQRCRDIASRTAVLQGFVAGLLAEALAFDPDSIGPGLDFRGAGLNSVQSIDIFDRVMEQARIQLPPMVLYEYPTLGAFSRFLAEQFATFHPPETAMAAQPQTEAVADSPALAELLTRMTRVESTLLEMSRQLAGQPPAAPVTPSVASDSDEVSGVSKRVGEDAGPWLRIHRAAGVATRLRLVCFHSAGLDARMYDAWAALLPASVELVAVELPGRGQHPGKPIETMQALLPAIAAALETRLSAPYVLFGHSFGALVAYAFCRYQCARGGPRPARLMIASFWAPDEFVIRPELTRMMANKAPPGLASDQKIMDSWVYQPGEGLPLPITVFHGARDMMVPQEKIFGWRKQSSVAVDLHILEGGHFQLTTDPALQMTARALLALHLAPAATGTALTVEAGARSDVGDERLERLMAAHDAEFGSAADTRGSWNLWDLNHLARARAEADDGEGSAGPAFQEALNTLLQLLRPEGHYGRLRSPYPYCNLALAITTLNTLLCWHDGGEHDYAVYFDGLQRQILETDRQRKRDIFRGVELPFGRYFKFPGMFGESMVPELEGALLLRLGREILLPEVVQLLQAVAGQFSEARVERYFRFGEFALPFPESYPEAVIRSPRLEAFAQGALPELPGFSTAFAARYFDVTRSLETRAALDRTLRDADLMRNLRPAGKLQEVYFALNFLNKSGIDLKTWYPKGLRYLRETQQPYGVGIDELALDVDVDSTAIAMIVMQEQGLEPVIEQGAKVLERKWSEEQGSYRSTLGYFFNLNMLVLAVRATLLDRNAPADLKRTLCQRLSDHLTGRQWISVDHVSPFYLWESVLSLLCEFHQQFSADTLAHVPALLELILPMQQADGGFRSYLFAESDIEETGLAVLALKSALRGPLEPAADATLRDSIRRAERFLLAHLEVIADPDHHFPEQWIGTLLFSPPKIVRAIVLASLLKAPMAVGQGEGISRLCR
jgi:surfactin synthase thioesterase subunit/acyl carrier protein